jgi:hypothetical protein
MEDIDHAPDEIVSYTTAHDLRVSRFRSLLIRSHWPPANFGLWNIVGLCAKYDFIITATGCK